MQRDESRHDFAFIAGVVVGAIAGALATLALTPMSGPETRERLREHAGDLAPVKERAASVASVAQQRATSMAGSAQQIVATGREKATELAAKTPLPVHATHDGDATVASTAVDAETDTMMAENPSTASGSAATESGDVGAQPLHTEDPAEGRSDRPPRFDRISPTGSGRTPHPTDPAEGSADVPPSSTKPESDPST